MTSEATTPDEYIQELPAERKEVISQLRKIILKNLPKGFQEVMQYGMLSYVVPHQKYPDGYHCNPEHPLPFVSLSSQKNFIALYHMGIYAMPAILKWFEEEYSKQSLSKLDMGKSCIRFKKTEHIPFKLIGELMKKISVDDWINTYEKNIKKKT
ncbi:MAG: DUF1801 domain-containing protein [Chitinophagaceae bacterium]